MANVHGKDAELKMDDTADSLTDISAYVDTSALQRAIELADTTAYKDEDRTFIAGLATGSIPIGGPWDSALDAFFGTTAQMKVARGWEFDPTGTDSPKWTGESFIQDYTIDVPVGDKVAWSATLVTTGAITRA